MSIFSVTGDSSNLGEEPYNLIVKAPEGMTFRDGTTEQTFPIDESNKYTVAFYGDLYGDLLAQQPLQVSFETEKCPRAAKCKRRFVHSRRTSADRTQNPVPSFGRFRR